MITIDPKFKKDVKIIRNYVKASRELSDFFIEKLANRIGLESEEDKEAIWDHIMNETDWTVQYKKGNK